MFTLKLGDDPIPEMFFKVETTNYYIYIYGNSEFSWSIWSILHVSLLVSPHKRNAQVLSQMLAGGAPGRGGSCWLLLENVAL